MKKYQNINKNAIDEINRTLMRFFGISIKRKNGEYLVVKYYDNGYSLGHYASETDARTIGVDHFQILDAKYYICEYASKGGNYNVRVVEGCTLKGMGDIRVLIEGQDKTWEVYCECDSKKEVPHMKLCLLRKEAIQDDNYVYMEAPETYVRTVPDGNLEEVKDGSITGAFYLLDELVLYTTFDGIYIKKFTEEGRPYFERCSMDLCRSSLISALENLILKSNACFHIKENASKKVSFSYSDEDVVILKNFLSSRVDELLSEMSKHKKLYLARLDEAGEDKTSTIYKAYVKSGKTKHPLN